MTYRDALAWVYSLQQFGIKLGLENMRRLIAALQVDPGPTKIVHVAGTNGKGSVCAMVERIARADGLTAGLFISPHLVTFRERIRVNGEMISEDAVARELTQIRELVGGWDPHPTFFEITTALALNTFFPAAEWRARPDIVVLETGLGGRLDATNVIEADVSVITPIGLDHQKWLGSTIAEIAAEKAGIIKPHRPVISAAQPGPAEEVIRARARQCEAPLEFVTEPYTASPVALPGEHQKLNAALAIAAINACRGDGLKRSPSSGRGCEISQEAIARGLASVEWPARFQYWDDRTIIDGAHNPAATRVLAATWRGIFGSERATLILGILGDKDIGKIGEELASITDVVLLPQIRSERAAAPEQIREVLSRVAPSLPCSITPTFADALTTARSRPRPILITGSLHFAGEALAELRGVPAAFEECAQ